MGVQPESMNSATWHCAPCMQWWCARGGLPALLGLVALCAQFMLEDVLPDAGSRFLFWSGLMVAFVGERLGLLDRWASLMEIERSTVEEDRAFRPKAFLIDCLIAAGAAIWGLWRWQADAWGAHLGFVVAGIFLTTGLARWYLTAPIPGNGHHTP